MKNFILILLGFLISVVSFAQDSYVDIIHQDVFNISGTAQSNTFVGDFNNDGKIEVAFATGNSNKTYLKFLHSDGNEYTEHRIEIPVSSEIMWMDYDSTKNKIYIAEADKLTSYDPISNNVEVIYDGFSNTIQKFQFHKTDSTTYFLLRSWSYLYLVNEEGALIAQDYFSSMNDFAIGNVDDESDMEIVLSLSSESKILDLLTFSEEWVYFDDFGSFVTLADYDNDGISLVYGNSYDELKCFDIQAESEIWSVDISLQNSPPSYVPGDSDNDPVLLFSSNSGISARNLETGNQFWQIESPSFNNYGMQLIDLDGDGGRDLFYVSGSDVVVRDIDASSDWIKDYKGSRMHIDLVDRGDGDVIDYVTCSGSSNGSDGGLFSIHDGISDEIITGPIELDNFSDIDELASIHVANNTYYLAKEDYGEIFLYRNTLSSVYGSLDNFDTDINELQLIQLTEDGAPYIVGINNTTRFVLYSITGGNINLVWESPSTSGSCKSYKIGNFDSDEALEVALLYTSAIVVYDLESQLLEKQIIVNYNSDHNAFDVFDYHQDGTIDFIIGGKTNYNETEIQVIDFETEAVEEIIIIDKEVDLRLVKFINLDTTVSPEMIVLADKFYVFDVENNMMISEVDAFPLEVSNRSIDINDIEIVDLDLDKHLDILIAHQFGYVRMKVKSEFIDTKLPFVKEYSPSSTLQNLPTNTTITVEFSEEIDITSLDEIVVKDQSGNSLDFYTEMSQSLKVLDIKPTATWTANEVLEVVLPSSISDLAGNSLDGNRNGVADDVGDDYQIILNMGSGLDNILPFFTDLEIQSEIFPGQIVNISGIATDENDDVTSTIKQILYSLDNDSVIEEGMNIESVDGNFDSSTENFALKINSTILEGGEHTVYLRVQDYSENWSDLDSIIFTILEESDDNWNVHGKDSYNTSYAPSSTFTYPVTLKYSIENNINSFDGLSRCIVVGSKMIYTSENRLWVRDVETGLVDWMNTYDNSDKLSTACYAYGNLYVQVGDHSDSQLICLSLTDGELLWATDYSVQWSDLTGPIVADGNIIIVEGYYDTTISAYDAYNGNVKWKRDISGNNFDDWNPAVYEGKIYGYSDNFSVIELETGVELVNLTDDDLPYDWSGWSVIGNPLIDTTNNQVVLTNQDFVFSLDLDSYEINWSISSNDFGSFTSTPALSGNSLYIGTTQRIMELNASNAEVIWDNENFRGNFDPVVSDSIIAFSSWESLVIIDKETKEVKGGFNGAGNLTLTGGYLILTEDNGEFLYVLEKGTEGVVMTAEIILTDSIMCYGESTAALEVIVNGGSGELQYSWEDVSSNTSTRNFLPAGEYSVTIFDDFFNSVEQSIVVTEPEEMILTTSSTDEINGNSNGTATVTPTGGTSPYTYVWADFPGISIPTIPNLDAGNYIVEVIDANGCEAITTVIVYSVTGTSSSNEHGISILPTVTSGEFSLEISSNLLGSEYTIINQTGSIVKQGQVLSEITTFSEVLPVGVYFMVITNGESSSSSKFIIIR